MRSKLLTQLRTQLNRSLTHAFPNASDISDDPSFSEGHIGFFLECVDGYFSFLALVANDDSDSFRANFAWSKSPTYPQSPYRDLRATIDDFLQHDEGEFQLALLSKESIPWVWHLDSGFGKWKAELDKVMASMASGSAGAHEQYPQVLRQMPKKCPIGEAMAMVPLAVDQLVGVLDRQAKPYIRALAGK